MSFHSTQLKRLFSEGLTFATGEMEVRTPDQVRYYRLPPAG